MSVITSIIRPQMLKGATPKCSHQLLALSLILAERISGRKRLTISGPAADLRSLSSAMTLCAISFHIWVASKRRLVNGLKPATGSVLLDLQVMPDSHVVIPILECHEYVRLPKHIYCKVNFGHGDIWMPGAKEFNYRHARRRTDISNKAPIFAPRQRRPIEQTCPAVVADKQITND